MGSIIIRRCRRKECGKLFIPSMDSQVYHCTTCRVLDANKRWSHEERVKRSEKEGGRKCQFTLSDTDGGTRECGDPVAPNCRYLCPTHLKEAGEYEDEYECFLP